VRVPAKHLRVNLGVRSQGAYFRVLQLTIPPAIQNDLLLAPHGEVSDH